MLGYSLLTPIPIMHLHGALDILKERDFALFGSEAFDVFEKTDIGTKLLIYASHDEAEQVVSYAGIYDGIVGNPAEMRRLERQGFRPESTAGEKWAFYWKARDIQALDKSIPLSDIQLPSGSYLAGYPRGPIHVLS